MYMVPFDPTVGDDQIESLVAKLQSIVPVGLIANNSPLSVPVYTVPSGPIAGEEKNVSEPNETSQSWFPLQPPQGLNPVPRTLLRNIGHGEVANALLVVPLIFETANAPAFSSPSSRELVCT